MSASIALESSQLVVRQGDSGQVSMLVQRALNRGIEDPAQRLVEDGKCGPRTIARAMSVLGRKQRETFLTQAELGALGIRTQTFMDLSGHNEGGPKRLVNPEASGKAGISLIYFKTSEGRNYVNEEARRQARLAIDAGLGVAGYHFSRPDTDVNRTDPTEDARAEARHYIRSAADLLGPTFHAPHANDFEAGLEVTGRVDEDIYNLDWVEAWHEYVEANPPGALVSLPGWPVWVDPTLDYTGRWATQLYAEKAPPARRVRLARRLPWIASYNHGSEPARMPVIWQNWLFWQFRNDAQIPGVDGNVDLSRYVYLET